MGEERGGLLRRAGSCGSRCGGGWRGGLSGKAEREEAGRVRQTDSLVFSFMHNKSMCFWHQLMTHCRIFSFTWIKIDSYEKSV